MTHLVELVGSCPDLVVSGPPDRRIGQIAVMQAGRVSRRQLAQAGITPSMIRTRIRRSQLLPEHAGVWAVGHRASVGYSRETAALLAVGDRAVLSHETAAQIWDVSTNLSLDDPVDVTVVARHPSAQDGIHLHRVRSLDPLEVRDRHGLPVTSPARTALDLAACATDRRLELVVDQMLVARIVTLRELRAVLDRNRNHGGRRKMRLMLERLAGPMLTRSEAEERMLALLRAAELPRPRVNDRLLGFEVDFHWRSQRLVVEVDGFRFHSTRSAFERDRRRDAVLAAAGITTLRITWRQLEEQPYAVIAWIAAALARQVEAA